MKISDVVGEASSLEEVQQPSENPTPEKVRISDIMSGPSASPVSESSKLFSEEGLKSFGLRTKLGFAEGPKEKLDILNKNGIEAFLVNNEIRYVDKKTGKLNVIDEPDLSVYDIADLIGETPEQGGMFIGGTLGGLAGTRGGVKGVFAGGAAGSSAGGTAGRILKSEFAKSFGADISPRQELLRAGESGITGFVSDPIGRGLFATISKIAAPVVNKLVSGFKEANEILGKSIGPSGRPLTLTPGQATTSRLVDTAENVAESSFLGATKLVKLKEAQEKALDNAVSEFTAKISRGNFSKEEYGRIVQDAIEKKGQTFRIVENKIWGEVDRFFPDTQPVNVAAVKKWAKEQLATTAQARKLAPSISGPKGNKTVDILEDISNLPDNVSFTTTHEWVSNLFAITKNTKNTVLNTKEIGTLKELNRRLNLEIDNTGKSLEGADLVNAFNTARGFTKKWRTVFDDKLVKSLVNTEPQKVADILFKPNSIEGIRTARISMGPKAFQQVKGAFVSNLFKPDDPNGLAGAQILKRISKFDNPTLREIFNKPSELKDMMNLANTIKLIQGGQGKHIPGGVAIQLTQPGALIQLAGATTGVAGFPKTAAAIVFGPVAIGRIFTHPLGIKWFTEGLKLPKGSQAATRITTNMLSVLGRDMSDVKLLDENESALIKIRSKKLSEVQDILEKRKEGIPLLAEEEIRFNEAFR